MFIKWYDDQPEVRKQISTFAEKLSILSVLKHHKLEFSKIIVDGSPILWFFGKMYPNFRDFWQKMSCFTNIWQNPTNFVNFFFTININFIFWQKWEFRQFTPKSGKLFRFSKKIPLSFRELLAVDCIENKVAECHKDTYEYQPEIYSRQSLYRSRVVDRAVNTVRGKKRELLAEYPHHQRDYGCPLKCLIQMVIICERRFVIIVPPFPRPTTCLALPDVAPFRLMVPAWGGGLFCPLPHHGCCKISLLRAGTIPLPIPNPIRVKNK